MAAITWAEVKDKAPKVRESYTKKFLCDPIAIPLVYLVIRYTRLTPVHITVLSLVLGIVTGVAFGLGMLATGAILYYIHFLTDAMDGKMSRVKGDDDTYRGTLDFIGDSVAEVCIIVGLAVNSDKTLALLLVIFTAGYLLYVKCTSMVHRLLAQRELKTDLLATREMEQVYLRGADNVLVAWAIRTYSKIAYRLAKHGLIAIPPVSLALLLPCMVGPLAQSISGDIALMYWFALAGIGVIYPITLGPGVLAYTLAKGKAK